MFIAKEHKWLRAPAERHVLCGFELHAAPQSGLSGRLEL